MPGVMSTFKSVEIYMDRRTPKLTLFLKHRILSKAIENIIDEIKKSRMCRRKEDGEKSSRKNPYNCKNT